MCKPPAFRHLTVGVTLVCFVLTMAGPLPKAYAAAFPVLPPPGARLPLSSAFTPAQLRGITIDPKNPFHFEFLIQRGNKPLAGRQQHDEYQKLIKYFLATLTTPEKNLWVNLSPYEKDRIIEANFGKTEMGRDLLAQDYILKQITASLIYPEEGLGKEFWDKIYKTAYEQFGTSEISVNTFNKVWIIPEEASIYEQGNSAYIVHSHLKVMLEEDYLALNHNVIPAKAGIQKRINSDMDPRLRGDDKSTHSMASQIIRDIVLPAIEKEVNEGKNFAMLRQVFSAMILAEWYKRTLKNSLLGKSYVNQQKTKGVDQQDPAANQVIYHQYLLAFKKGVYNYIKEDEDKYTHQTIPRKYFSGGVQAGTEQWDHALKSVSKAQASESLEPVLEEGMDQTEVDLNNSSAAMLPVQYAKSQGLLKSFSAIEKRAVGQVLQRDIFAPMNHLAAQRTSLSGERTTPFIFFQHDFLLDNDSLGGVKMFALLEKLIDQLLSQGAFQRKWGGLLTSNQAPAFKPLLPQELGAMAEQIEATAGQSQLTGAVADFLEERGYDIKGRLSNVVFMREWMEGRLFSKREERNQKGTEITWNDKDIAALRSTMKSLNIKEKAGSIESQIPLMINFLLATGLITPQEHADLEKHWQGLSSILQQINASRSARTGGVDPYGNAIIISTQQNLITELKTRAYGRGEDFSMDQLILNYYTHTQIIYTILSNVFLRVGENVKPAVYVDEMVPSEINVPAGLSVQRLGEGFYKDGMNHMGYWDPAAPRLPDPVLRIHGNSIEADIDLFQSEPSAMMDVFLLAARTQALPSEQVITAMRKVIKEGSIDWEAQQGRLFEQFEQLLRVQNKISTVLLCMHETGLLAKILPNLANKDRKFDEYFHRYPITYHTIYLLYFLEYGMDDLLNQIDHDSLHKARELYGNLSAVGNPDTTPLLTLRLAILLHDSEKQDHFELGQQTHALAAANHMSSGLLVMPALDAIRDAVSWLIWYHGVLSSLAKSAADAKEEFFYSDLVYLADLIKKNNISPQLWSMFFLLTTADTNATDPQSSLRRFNNAENKSKWAMYTKMKNFLDAPDKDSLIAEWKASAKAQDEKIRNQKKAMVRQQLNNLFERDLKMAENDQAGIVKVQTFLGLDIEVPRVQQLIDNLREAATFDMWFEKYANMFPIQYFRGLEDAKATKRFLMLSLFKQGGYTEPVAMAVVGAVDQGDGPMFDIVAGMSQDRPLFVNKCAGLLTALGFNILDTQLYTSRNGTQIIFDRFSGYFVDAQHLQRLRKLWPQIIPLLHKHNIPVPHKVLATAPDKIIWDDVFPVLFKAVLEKDDFLDEIFALEGAVKVFKKINPKANKPSEVTLKFEGNNEQGRPVYSMNVNTDDRNGLLFTLTGLIGHGLRGNIEIEAPDAIHTFQRGVTDKVRFSLEQPLPADALLKIAAKTKELLDKPEFTLAEVNQAAGQLQAADYAMPSIKPSDKTGGIDLNPANMAMNVDHAQGSGPAAFTLTGSQWIITDGLTPDIIRITPVTTLPFLN